MSTVISAKDFDSESLPDWRWLLSRLEANFSFPDFTAAGGFVAEVARLADEQDHHPDIDLRYGVVHVATSSHDSGGVTRRDLRLAEAISAAADRASGSSHPSVTNTMEIAIDALDIDAIRPFWAAVLGYGDQQPPEGDDGQPLTDPRGILPTIWFQQMDQPRPQRNRIHLDITVPAEVTRERIDATVAAGGELLDDTHADAFWVLADPEGNEACVCTSQPARG